VKKLVKGSKQKQPTFGFFVVFYYN